MHMFNRKRPIAHLVLAIAIFSGLLVGCTLEESGNVRADLTLLSEIADEGEEQTMGVFGGSGKKLVKPVETENATLVVRGGRLQLNFGEKGRFQFTPGAVGLPESWYRLRTIDLTVETETAGPLLFEVYGSRTRLIDTLQLGEGRQSVTVDITETPLLGGIEAKPSYIRLTSFTPRSVDLVAISMTESAEHPFLVDKWGQRARAEWPDKVHTLEELTDVSAEQAILASLSDEVDMDDYGGYRDHDLPLEKKGFFHTQFVNGRWLLVTPAGNPFYSLGVNGVRIKSIRGNADVSRVAGREWLFEEIPTVEDCPECFREDGRYFSYYCWNVKRKYGGIEKWRAHTYDRLTAVGFNTIGNWSDTVFYKDAQMPYTYTLDTRKNPDFVMENGMPDVFHPDWESYLADNFAEITRFREDPYLLGYFVDNEMGWRSVPRLDTASHTGRKLASLPTEEAQMQAYAERYFSTIEQTINRFDPNHLYLGCRFTRNFRKMEPIAKAAGRYLDVLSINVYSAYPVREQIDQWYDAARKPILISEHHIPPVTQKQFLPHWPAFETEERNEMVKDYVYTWLDFPYAVGSHWYQYKDQEVAGRGDGGENQPVGLATVTDKLNEELVRTYYEISREIPKRLLWE